MSSSSGKSVHSANIAEIHEMPMSEIIRPIPSVLDDKKVDSIAEALQVRKIRFNCVIINMTTTGERRQLQTQTFLFLEQQRISSANWYSLD